MSREKIEFVNIDRFKPLLYADLYIPSWVNGYSIAMEFVHNWFLSKFHNDNYFKTVHIIGKHTFEDFRRFEFGDYAKREKPALSIGGTIQYDYNFENIDLHLLGIEGFVKKTNYQKSFFKNPVKKLYLGLVPEVMAVDFVLRCRVDTRSEQLDLYKRLELLFRIGCTETMDVDMNFHVPYKLMRDLARDSGYDVQNDVIMEPYDFLKYLNQYSQVPFLYKLRYINGKHEYFIRMNNMPLYLDTRNSLDPDDGEQEGQTSTNYHIEMRVGIKIPVPKFYIYYAEGKEYSNIITNSSDGVDVYSMKVFDIPEVNSKGWVQYGTSNYLKDENEESVKNIDISELFTAPVDTRVGISLDDIISDALLFGISPSTFIDIQIYTNDMVVTGKLPIDVDWENRTITLPDNMKDNYYYIVIYTELGYINSKIIEKSESYKSRITDSKKTVIDRSGDTFSYEPNIEK